MTQQAHAKVPTPQGKQGKQGKWQNKIPVRENTGNLEMLPKHTENTQNLVCSSCHFPDPKGKRYLGIAAEISIFFRRIWIRQFFCI